VSTSELHPDVVRAALPIAVLALLAEQPAHGYALVETLKNLGFERVQGGTLYPLLKRFEDRSLVTHEWLHDESGPGRKQFALTQAGHLELTSLREAWGQVTTVITDLSSTAGKEAK
jgi:PadR family transcriptional regulator PadR